MDITDIYIYIFIHSFIYAIICDKKAFFWYVSSSPGCFVGCLYERHP